MTFQYPQGRTHIVDLLPAYINGTLDAVSNERVHDHLRFCEACQFELLEWNVVQDTTRFVVEVAPLPSLSVLEKIMARIDTSVQVPTARPSLLEMLLHFWLVFKRQIPVLHKSIWLGCALAIAFGCILASLAAYQHVETANFVLALFASVIGSAGVAFIYGPKNDAGFELTLATPTSIRIVMICRMVLVTGYTIALTMCASVIVALVHGESLSQIVVLWLGPLLLLSSLSLFLSLLLGSTLAIFGSVVLEVTQTLRIGADTGGFVLTHSMLWQTNPIIILLAVLLIILTVIYAPRQPRLT